MFSFARMSPAWNRPIVGYLGNMLSTEVFNLPSANSRKDLQVYSSEP